MHTNRNSRFSNDLMDGRILAIGKGAAPKANLSNAGYLTGDPAPYGDMYRGDPSFQGDPAPYGDLHQTNSALANYDTLIGDMVETGGFNLADIWSKLPMAAKIALGGLGAGAATFGAVKGVQAIKKAHQRHLSRKQALAAAQARSHAAGNTHNMLYARQHLNKIAPSQLTSFYQVQGASLGAYPISPKKVFPFKSLTWCFDQQSNTTPFVANITNATQPGGAGTNYIINIPGTTAGQYYSCVFIIIGGNILQASPGINFNVTATLPLVGGGSLSISAQPFTFTLGGEFYSKICLFPWTLVASEPVYTAGFFSAANPINIQVSGSIPNPAAISAVVPGSLHPWTIGLRTAGL